VYKRQVYVDLGAVSAVDQVNLAWIRRPESAVLEVSDDAKSWRQVQAAASGENRFAAVQARYVRVMVKGSGAGGAAVLSEMEVYGTGGVEAVAAAARLLGEHDSRLWRVLHHHVEEARARVDMSGVTRIGVDETAARRGHDYITLFHDLDERKLLYGTPGRDHTVVQDFKADLIAHQGTPEQIQEACIDMSNAFIKGLSQEFPDAHLTFDRFHVMKLMGEALDAVRRQESRERPELKRTRYFWLRNPENLKAEQRERLRVLQGLNLRTAQAYQLKLTLQDFYEQSNLQAATTFLEDWCELALASGLEPVKKVAQTLKERAAGVLRWFTERLTNGLLEGINSILQAAKAKARGYRTTRNLITIAYLLAGRLHFALPT